MLPVLPCKYCGVVVPLGVFDRTTSLITTLHVLQINKYAFSGGGATLIEHQANGADLDVDVPWKYLRFFMEDDNKLDEIQDKYGRGLTLEQIDEKYGAGSKLKELEGEYGAGRTLEELQEKYGAGRTLEEIADNHKARRMLTGELLVVC